MRTASHSPQDITLPVTQRKTPPGPRGWPLVGSTLEVFRDPLTMFCDGRARFGDTVQYRFGPMRFVLLHNPNDIAHVLVKNHRNYTKSRNYRGLKLVLGQGLVTSEGELWRRQRKLSQPAFHRKRLANLTDTMARCTQQMLDAWDQHQARKTSGEHRVDFHEQMMHLTLRIAGHTLFSTELAHEAGALGPAIAVALAHANEQVESLMPLPPWIPTPKNLRFRRAMRSLDATVHRIIRQRRSQPDTEHHDVLSMLMDATDESGTERMSDQQLRDEVMTLMLAGHETTATAMSWTSLLLSRHPDIATRVQQEAQQVLQGRAPTFEDLPQLRYTGQVIEESMRLYPPVWIVERAAIADDHVQQYSIPRGTVVAVCPWSLHRHPDLWPDPERFDPERFDPEHAPKRHRYAYLPFGAGPRVCIGNHFAMMEAKVILASLAQRYTIEIDERQPIGRNPGVTLRPSSGMPAVLTRL